MFSGQAGAYFEIAEKQRVFATGQSSPKQRRHIISADLKKSFICTWNIAITLQCHSVLSKSWLKWGSKTKNNVLLCLCISFWRFSRQFNFSAISPLHCFKSFLYIFINPLLNNVLNFSLFFLILFRKSLKFIFSSTVHLNLTLLRKLLLFPFASRLRHRFATISPSWIDVILGSTCQISTRSHFTICLFLQIYSIFWEWIM